MTHSCISLAKSFLSLNESKITCCGQFCFASNPLNKIEIRFSAWQINSCQEHDNKYFRRGVVMSPPQANRWSFQFNLKLWLLFYSVLKKMSDWQPWPIPSCSHWCRENNAVMKVSLWNVSSYYWTQNWGEENNHSYQLEMWHCDRKYFSFIFSNKQIILT